ncbi:hypothetical protein KQI65_08095 [bacterium]|nr:hypothetical protein [bacterium]
MMWLLTATGQAQNLSNIGENDPFRLGGSVSARGVLYEAQNIDRRRQPFSWVLNGTLNLNIYDMDLPFSFTFSEQEREFAQPFNQFGASPTYKWVKGHVGYRSMTFSPYTLAGHQFLGAGVEMNPGLLRLGLMYGRFQRAVEEDTSSNRFVQPAYSRSGYSAKLGVGNSSNYFDVIMLKAKDDEASLRRAPTGSLVLPGENLVLGIAGTTELFDGFRLMLDAAASDYTRDVRASAIDDPDNTHIEAFDALNNNRSSTQFYTAVKAGATYSYQRFSLAANYTRIDPDYQSMGAYHITNDLQSFAIAPRFVLLEGRLRVSTNLTFRHDNLQNKKPYTTSRFIPVVAISLQPGSSFGVDLNYTDVFSTQSDGYRAVNDSLRLDQQNPMIMLSPRYSIIGGSASHTFLLGVMYQTLVDNNAFTSRWSEYSTTNLNLTYTLALTKAQFSMSASANTTRLENAGGTYRNSGVSVNASKGLLEQALRLTAGSGVSFHATGETVTGTLGARYALQKRHSFTATLNIVNSSAGYYAQERFSEYTLVLGYAYTF